MFSQANWEILHWFIIRTHFCVRNFSVKLNRLSNLTRNLTRNYLLDIFLFFNYYCYYYSIIWQIYMTCFHSKVYIHSAYNLFLTSYWFVFCACIYLSQCWNQIRVNVSLVQMRFIVSLRRSSESTKKSKGHKIMNLDSIKRWKQYGNWGFFGSFELLRIDEHPIQASCRGMYSVQ